MKLVSFLFFAIIVTYTWLIHRYLKYKKELILIRKKRLDLKKATKLIDESRTRALKKAKKRWRMRQSKMQQKIIWLQLYFYVVSLIFLALIVLLYLYVPNKTDELKVTSPVEILTTLNTPENPKSINENQKIDTTPHPFMQPATLSTKFLDLSSMTFFTDTIEITVLKTIRGADAWNILVDENQFNPPATDGKEYIINRVRIKILDSSETHTSIKLSNFDFSYLLKTGEKYEPCILVVPDSLPDEIAPNVIVEGNIYCLINSEDQPIISFQDKLFMSVK